MYKNIDQYHVLAIVGKIMERSVYKYVHNYLLAHCIITPHQSGFTRGDSVINQLFIYNQWIWEGFRWGERNKGGILQY